ncbi:unnamed protein product [Ranitomeya imitator]|uniref:Dynamin-type G domain-containing protein n=1 Tax=Ranitomeya imitator TaxID=111125 RepID=A0ABN9KZL1_9NEOB|nr:unnamed protein product [Ranitomeya imitator]
MCSPEDNARPHVAGVCQQFLQDEAIEAMDWPARSPDLNPIEHIWDIMSRSIHQCHVAPQTVQELVNALVQESSAPDHLPFAATPAHMQGSLENINADGRQAAFQPGFGSPVSPQYYPDQDNTPATVALMDKGFQEKIRPCIDLIDSLRSFGVEKDLALPAIAVIGDQSSGKSSVLEALSGVTLPRGTGIVTRCPLELKLKKSATNSPWFGRIIYRNTKTNIPGPFAVEAEVRRAQDIVAGSGNGISEDLITLEIISPNVPDLTLIDLPGITRIALPNQPQDIGSQVCQDLPSRHQKEM